MPWLQQPPATCWLWPVAAAEEGSSRVTGLQLPFRALLPSYAASSSKHFPLGTGFNKETRDILLKFDDNKGEPEVLLTLGPGGHSTEDDGQHTCTDPQDSYAPALPACPDGRIDASEIQAVVSTLVAEKFKSRAFRIGLIILGVFTVILLGAMFGLTWAVVAALKDTKVRFWQFVRQRLGMSQQPGCRRETKAAPHCSQVSGSVLVTNDGSADAVMTANMDVTVKGGLLVSRNSSGVVTTSPLKTKTTLSVNTPFDSLVKLQSLVVRWVALSAQVAGRP